MSKRSKNKVKHWLPLAIYSLLMTLIGAGSFIGIGLITGGSILIFGLGGLILAGLHGWLFRRALKRRKTARMSKAQAKETAKEVEKSKEKVKELQEEKVKKLAPQQVQTHLKKVALDDFMTPSESVNSFVIYEADGKTIKHINNQELRYKISADENYKRYLQEYLRNYMRDHTSGDCVIEVFGPDAKKDENGKLVGKSFNLNGEDYKSSYGALVSYIDGLSKNLRDAELVRNV